MDHSAFYTMGNNIVARSSPNSSEVELRTAIGRVYYYVYHEILSWVKTDELLSIIYEESEIFSTHKKLINVFYELAKDTQDLNYGKISRLLVALHTFRCKADYVLDDLIDASLFESIIVNIEDLKEACFKYNKGLFPILMSEKPKTIGIYNVGDKSIEIRKKPTLRILD